jgi:hypothetical protein
MTSPLAAPLALPDEATVQLPVFAGRGTKIVAHVTLDRDVADLLKAAWPNLRLTRGPNGKGKFYPRIVDTGMDGRFAFPVVGCVVLAMEVLLTEWNGGPAAPWKWPPVIYLDGDPYNCRRANLSYGSGLRTWIAGETVRIRRGAHLRQLPPEEAMERARSLYEAWQRAALADYSAEFRDWCERVAKIAGAPFPLGGDCTKWIGQRTRAELLVIWKLKPRPAIGRSDRLELIRRLFAEWKA